MNEATGRCAIGDVQKKLISKLSKGYRQRVGSAQAILHNPDVLILDEPTSGLDPKQIIETRELIASLSGDHTIILSTHILSEVEHRCRKVLIINRGRIVASESVSDLTSQMRSGADAVALEIQGSIAQSRGCAPALRADSRRQPRGSQGCRREDGQGSRVLVEVERCMAGQSVRPELARAVVKPAGICRKCAAST